MSNLIFILVGIAMAITLGVLFAGIVVMAKGGQVNAKYGNKLMRARIIAQGCALALLVLAFLIGK